MNVRAVVTEVLAIAMAAIFFVNIFIDIPYGIWARTGTFVAFIILAIYLIRGVLREASQREELNVLNRTLEDKVAAQTEEIRHSYEAEKHARMELEKLNDAKDQFIMITQHHLRTPVVSMNWALESALAGAYGAISGEAKAVLESALASGRRLMGIVNDFLNITAIKVGTNILSLSRTSLLPIVDGILAELTPEIARLKLSVSHPTDQSAWPELTVDADKLRESLFIVIENAARYNEAGGRISIEPQGDGRSFTLTVTNTGIGIDREEKQKIGSSLFYRGQEARKSNPIGMGIGLSVAKAIIRAHHGSFTIDSNGRGTGARATIILPLER